MVECPVCGAVGPPGQTGCAACGLPSEMFEPVRDIADPAEEAKFTHALEELTGARPPVHPGPSPPLLLESPAPAVDDRTLEEPSVPGGEELHPETGGRVEDLPGPWEEALRIGRALGLDLSRLMGAMRQARSDGDPVQLSRLRHSLVRSVLDGLVDRYRTLCDRRDAIARRVRTQALDADLAAYRKALSGGELARAEEQRQNAQRTVESIEASWSRIKTQFTEAGQMIRALREMGGVAPGVLRPVAEAIRIPRRGEAGQIERRLKRANGLLWGLLVPRMNYQISKGRSLLNETQAPAALTEAISSEIARMTENIRDQNISKALESRLFLRVALSSLAPRVPRRPVRRSFVE
ncbi:MAG: zinc ribbon domain-containing protein [Thermoplasmata archaeon]|nr:zinc ribbon domain-containing protein [Thermoplasmata archaeon]